MTYDRRADLSPPLGYPGGPCHVLDRIDHSVHDPRLKEQLLDEVQDGDSLTNPEAAKVYTLEHEQGAGLVKKLLIGVHAQYRMDLRGVTVPEIRAALKTYTKQFYEWKSQNRPEYKRDAEALVRGDGVRWVDHHLGITIVFSMSSRDTAQLITTFRQGVKDPAPPKPGECKMAERVAARAV